jgi:hypothetical protein
MPLLVNLLAAFTVVLCGFATARVLSYALLVACLQAAAFLAAGLAHRAGAWELGRDVAAALNGACMLMASGLAIMSLSGILDVFEFFPAFVAAAGLATWNLVRLTDDKCSSTAGRTVTAWVTSGLRNLRAGSAHSPTRSLEPRNWDRQDGQTTSAAAASPPSGPVPL